MEQEPDDDASLQPPARKGGFSGLLQLVRTRRQAVPAPFRESDFVASEWGASAFDTQPLGRAE